MQLPQHFKLKAAFFLCLLLLIFQSKGQEIVVNEYFNAAGQNDEWTELVVVKDNLDLSGWYIGDNNAATGNWQPKIRFKNDPLWKNLRAGTIIQIDHAANLQGCDDATDVDKSDGFIRVCCRNATYFEGGSATTLFLADDGDFVQLVDPSGKMIHGFGHDNDPGNSVEGGTCFTTSNNWTNTNSAQPATRPCGNFVFYRFKTAAPTSLYVAAGETADFFAGMQSQTSNGFIDTSDVPFEGIGNAGLNSSWVVKQRRPIMSAQDVCFSKAGDGTISFSWQAATDPFPSDNTIGYLVVRNTTGDFSSPSDGTQYALNQTFGIGPQQSTVVGIIGNSQTTTFSENPGAGSFYYRVFPFRYKNTVGFQHFTRGRTYNSSEFVKVSQGVLPPYIAENDTLCGPGTAKLRLFFPVGVSANWYSSAVDPNPIQTNQDTLKIFVNQTTSFWAGLGGVSTCANDRIEVKAVVQPFDFSYISSDSICEGTPAFLRINQNPLWKYDWKIINPLPGMTYSRLDSSEVEINVPHFDISQAFLFSVKVTNEKGCVSPTKNGYVYTVPFTAELVSNVSEPSPNQSVLVFIQSNKTNAVSFNWSNSGGTILSQDFQNCLVKTADSITVNAILGTILPTNVPFCRVSRSVKLRVKDPLPPIKPIPSLVTRNGDQKNDFLDFDRRLVNKLEVFNRWGKQVYSSGNYTNDWPGNDENPGVYFFRVDFENPDTNQTSSEFGWVNLVKE